MEDQIQIFRRPISPSDPNLSVGIWLASWQPLADPSIGMLEQDLVQYSYGLSTLVKSDNRESGLRISAILAKKVRLALVRNQEFRVQLQSLREDEDGFSPFERVLRYKYERITYDDMALSNGGFLYLTAAIFNVDTEIAS